MRVHARQPRREQAGAPAHRGRCGHWRGMCCPRHARIGWFRRRRRRWVGVLQHCQSARGVAAAGRECSGRGGSGLDVSLSGRWHCSARMAELSGQWVTGRKGGGSDERAAELSGARHLCRGRAKERQWVCRGGLGPWLRRCRGRRAAASGLKRKVTSTMLLGGRVARPGGRGGHGVCRGERFCAAARRTLWQHRWQRQRQ